MSKLRLNTTGLTDSLRMDDRYKDYDEVKDGRLTDANAEGDPRNPLFNDKPTPNDSFDAINHLIRYFHENPEQRISIEKACQLIGMGRRNLYYQFSKYTGLSPQKYFSRVRLSYLCQDLVYGDLSVTELAMKYNFSHLGDFSALYRDTYGELPSETRRRKSIPVALDSRNYPDVENFVHASLIRKAG